MKKFLISTIILSILAIFPLQVNATENQKQIPVLNIQTLQGVISESNSPDYIFIDTIDGNGWAVGSDVNCNTDLKVGDNVIIVFDNVGTDDIYDDEIILISKLI